MPFPLITHLESARLVLRPVVLKDLADLLKINGDPIVTRFLPYPTWQSLEDGAAWFTRMEALASTGTSQQLVLARKSDSRVIGTALLFKYDEASSRVELGYVLGHSSWGQGFMREALRAICSRVFGSLKLRRIEAEVNPGNIASCRLLASIGFSLEGTLRQRWVTKGIPYDTNIYGCLVEDWQKNAQSACP